MIDELQRILEETRPSDPGDHPIHAVSAAMVEVVVRVAFADGTITDGEWDILLGALADGDETTVRDAVARCRKAFAARPVDAVRELDLRMLANVLSVKDARAAYDASIAVLDLAKTERADRHARLEAGTYRAAAPPETKRAKDVLDPFALRRVLRRIFWG